MTIRSVGVVIALAIGAPIDAAWAQQAIPVYVHISGPDDVSGPALSIARNEARRVWALHGVDLTWGDGAPSQPALYGAVVAVVLSNTEVASRRFTNSNQVLATTVFRGSTRVVYVSVGRVQHLAFGMKLPQSEGGNDHWFGILLGRVIAHEIGHVLLATHAHARTGLMRIDFGSSVLATDDAAVQLTTLDRERLRVRFSTDAETTEIRLALASPVRE
jgi:hypothetical protein